MSIETWAFVGAFFGAGLGLPMGFLLIEVIKAIGSRRSSDPAVELLEWAIGQREAKALEETQIANRWVRTYELEDVGLEWDEELEKDVRKIELPAYWVTQVIGDLEAGDPIPAQSPEDARANHARAVRSVRKRLGLAPA